MKCKYCGVETESSEKAINVVCSDCVSQGLGGTITPYFKDNKMNEKVKENKTEDKMENENKVEKSVKPNNRCGQVKYIIEKINSGETLESVLVSIRKDLPAYLQPDAVVRKIYVTEKSKIFKV